MDKDQKNKGNKQQGGITNKKEKKAGSGWIYMINGPLTAFLLFSL